MCKPENNLKDEGRESSKQAQFPVYGKWSWTLRDAVVHTVICHKRINPLLMQYEPMKVLGSH